MLEKLFMLPVFQAYALSVGIIVLTLYGLGFMTAKTRAERKLVVNPEDAAINGGAQVGEAEHPDVLRIKRAHLNLIENALPFFAIGFLYTLTSPGEIVAYVVFGLFVAARLFHAFFYLGAKQPFRTASFALGALCNVFMVFQVMRSALAALF